MACYWPIEALQDGPSGAVLLWPNKGAANIALPCGKCIGCRTDRAQQWAARCTHEASLWESNTFLTLTYDDDSLPQEGHLRARDLQLFIKRLRKYADRTSSSLDRDRSSNIRYFACGEYGEETDRPHYHALLFNARFNDEKRVGKDLYESAALAELWPYGQNRIGEVTPASANYIAQYNLKKQGQGDHDRDGVWRPAPFLRMSLRPAIGNDWLKKYSTDLQHGYLVGQEGRQQGIPRYYRKKINELDYKLAEQLEEKTYRQRLNHPKDNSPERRRDGEIIHKRRAELTRKRVI